VAAVSSAVERLRERRSLLLIAHRPELVRHADRVVELVDGASVPAADRKAA
jgi:ABC-type multidrug transport system fused ATPase/permease subunit